MNEPRRKSLLFGKFKQVEIEQVCNLKYLFFLCFRLVRFYRRMLLFIAVILKCLCLFDLNSNYDFHMLFRNKNSRDWLSLFEELFELIVYEVVKTFGLKSLQVNFRSSNFKIFGRLLVDDYFRKLIAVFSIFIIYLMNQSFDFLFKHRFRFF